MKDCEGVQKGSNYFQILLYVFTWYSSMRFLVLSNKFLISFYDFKFPIFLTLCHMLSSGILSAITGSLKIFKIDKIKSFKQLSKIGLLSFTFVTSVTCGNFALKFISVPLFQAVGATTPFFVAILAGTLQGRIEHAATYATLVPIALGTIIASSGEISLEIYGLFLCLFATFTRALKTVLQSILMNNMTPTPTLTYTPPYYGTPTPSCQGSPFPTHTLMIQGKDTPTPAYKCTPTPTHTFQGKDTPTPAYRCTPTPTQWKKDTLTPAYKCTPTPTQWKRDTLIPTYMYTPTPTPTPAPKKSREQIGIQSLLMYMAPFSVLWLTPLVFFLEPEAIVEMKIRANSNFCFFVLLFLNFLSAYFVNLGNFLVTKQLGALSLQVLENLSGVLVAGMSVFLFQNPVTPMGVIGYGMTLTGVFLYKGAKNQFETIQI